jgi:membrane protease YdiL (CAAX protease family)
MDNTAQAQIAAFDDSQPAPAAGNPAFPGFWISIGWIAMYMGFQLVFGIIAFVIAAVTDQSIIAMFKGGSANPEVVQAALMGKIGLPLFISVLLAGLATLAVLWRHLRPDNRKELIGLFAPSRLGTWQTIGIGVALMAASYVLNWLYGTYVVDGEEMQAGVNQLIKGVPKTPLNHLILFATIALIAPVLEELLFRGYLQTSLMRSQKPWLAIVIASAVFGAIHMQPLAFPVLMLLGAAFGYLYYLTGSLRTNIALHVINNSLAYLAMASGVSSGS